MLILFFISYRFNELTIETGQWSINNNSLSMEADNYKEILTGSANGYTSQCGNNDNFSLEFDGCVNDDYYYSAYLNENNVPQDYTLNGNTLVINNAYFYLWNSRRL